MENDTRNEEVKEAVKVLAKYNGNEVVVQSNDFLETPRNLSLQEYKFFMFLVSEVNPNGVDFPAFRVTAAEFAKAIGVENSTYVYRDLQAVTKRLMGRIVTIRKPEHQLVIQTHLISSIYYWCGDGCVDIQISKDMYPYLLELRRDFTQYKLSQITRLSSVYAVRLYELLKKQERLGSRSFFIDDLKKKLNVPDDKLEAFKDFRLCVLEIAKREINEKTDILIDFEFVKTRRKITTVQFRITPKDPKKAEKQGGFLELYNSAPDGKHVYELMEFGFKRNSANRLLCRLQNSDIENAILAVKERVKKGKCKNPKAMLRTALKERWTPASLADETRKRRPKSELTIEEVPFEENSKTEKAAESRRKKSSGFFSFLNKTLNK
jgi:plasmid replication initiation protein